LPYIVDGKPHEVILHEECFLKAEKEPQLADRIRISLLPPPKPPPKEFVFAPIRDVLVGRFVTGLATLRDERKLSPLKAARVAIEYSHAYVDAKYYLDHKDLEPFTRSIESMRDQLLKLRESGIRIPAEADKKLIEASKSAKVGDWKKAKENLTEAEEIIDEAIRT